MPHKAGTVAMTEFNHYQTYRKLESLSKHPFDLTKRGILLPNA